jgi:hypothetical protein
MSMGTNDQAGTTVAEMAGRVFLAGGLAMVVASGHSITSLARVTNDRVPNFRVQNEVSCHC